ncbi:GPP34 family phosphoprotein [Streptomyces sp. NPDC021356]|uniref:GOLPH3/VPS74 family protein n=1 Tax=Streptomyces sp. NPDC021356 TaxID=3154900 RepID=UPI0033C45B16
MPHGSPASPHPLSLPARLCLLAWDPAPSRPAGPGRPHHLVRAGALTELAQRGLLVDDGGIATPVDLDAGAGDPALDGLLELVRESRPRPWRTWVTLRAGYTLRDVHEQLAAGGWLRAGKRRLLGVLPAAEHTLERVDVARALRARARQVLEGGRPVAEVSERDAAVVVLALAADPSTVLPGGDRGHHRRRVEELAERSGAGDPALHGVVREIRTALRAAAASAPAPTGA